jgi:UrcA family protein
MKSVLSRALLLVMLGSVTAMADAAVDDAPAQRTVRFADLDLARSADVAVLYRRIRSAANAVCEPRRPRSLGSLARTRQCLDQAIARGVATVNLPLLTSMAQGAPVGPATIVAGR